VLGGAGGRRVVLVRRICQKWAWRRSPVRRYPGRRRGGRRGSRRPWRPGRPLRRRVRRGRGDPGDERAARAREDHRAGVGRGVDNADPTLLSGSRKPVGEAGARRRRGTSKPEGDKASCRDRGRRPVDEVEQRGAHPKPEGEVGQEGVQGMAQPPPGLLGARRGYTSPVVFWAAGIDGPTVRFNAKRALVTAAQPECSSSWSKPSPTAACGRRRTAREAARGRGVREASSWPGQSTRPRTPLSTTSTSILFIRMTRARV
jgi:hypothetical protein